MADTFQIPSFYMPFPARVNPHVDETRPRVRAWAHSMGLLEPQHTDSHHGGWSAEIFDRADFTRFTALTYPHASARELELLSGWHSVIWCLDDIFLPWCEALGKREQILDRIERLMSFLPVTAHAPVAAHRTRGIPLVAVPVHQVHTPVPGSLAVGDGEPDPPSVPRPHRADGDAP